MSRFNLIDEKWIPVRLSNGTRDELGIRDTMMQSSKIIAIEDPSPLVVAAVHRFLLAVLYRVLEGPTDFEEAKVLFKKGIPDEKVTAYFEKWRDRFWLIDDEYPFGQIPTFEPKAWRAWAVLAAEHNADNAKVLFDHLNIGSPGFISEPRAARLILATQTFSVSCGKSELAHTGTAPSATAAMVIPLGRTLHDTLIFSLVPQNREVLHADLSLWERGPESMETLRKRPERSVTGLADRYTWAIRSIRLDAGKPGQIEKVAFASGVNCSSANQTDPMLAYRIDDKRGKVPIQLRDRGLWRDFDSLLPDESHLAPQVIDHAVRLTRYSHDRFPESVIVIGQSNDKAKIEYWRMEHFALPEALLADRNVRSEIRQLLADAEAAQKDIWSACRSFARNILSRGDREPAKEDVAGFLEQIPATRRYWSLLESSFHGILGGYAANRPPDDIRWEWLKSIRDTIKMVWDEHRASVITGDAWAIRSINKSEKPVLSRLRELGEEIEKLKPIKENV